MFKADYMLRLLRNIVIAIVSVIWILPFTICGVFFLGFVSIQEIVLFEEKYGGGSFYNIEISQNAFVATMLLLAIVLFSWALVATNRLWPIKKK